MHGLNSLKDPMCIEHILNYDEAVKIFPPLRMASLEENVHHVDHTNGCLE